MEALVAFIASYLGAAFFFIAGGVPFTPFVVLWINFLVQVPIAIALGFDKPEAGLMERKPRPLSQPVISRSQWVRILLIGIIIAVATLWIERYYEAIDPVLAGTMAMVVFSMLNIAIGLSARSETGTAFNRDILSDRRQLMLYGLAFLLTFLATELGFLQRFLGTTSLTLQQWLICIVAALFLLLIDEVVKSLMRRRHGLPAEAAPVTGVVQRDQPSAA
jgi:Ca2+-transporting ATPase